MTRMTKDQLIEAVIEAEYHHMSPAAQEIVRRNFSSHVYTTAKLRIMLSDSRRAAKDAYEVLGYGRDRPGEPTLFTGTGEAPFRNGKLITVHDVRKYAPALLESLHEEALRVNEDESEDTA